MTSTSTDSVRIPLAELQDLACRVLLRQGLSRPHAEAMARTVVAGQRDDCQSHGVYRLVTCAQTIRAGKVDLQAEPVVAATGGAVVQVDARYGFSPLAFERGLPALVEAARTQGVGALVIRHCFHFSALWPEVEAVTGHGLAALALTPSHAWVAPAGGRQPVFGTNPIAFGWPRPGPHPFVFDFATTAPARPCPRAAASMRRAGPAPIPSPWRRAPCWPSAATRARRCRPWSS
jgi:LDH2 family malate/lactate/ureidoglycolate dehydrogenase